MYMKKKNKKKLSGDEGYTALHKGRVYIVCPHCLAFQKKGAPPIKGNNYICENCEEIFSFSE